MSSAAVVIGTLESKLQQTQTTTYSTANSQYHEHYHLKLSSYIKYTV